MWECWKSLRRDSTARSRLPTRSVHWPTSIACRSRGSSFDGSGNTGRDIMKALERRYPFGLIPYFGSKPGGRFYVNARTACAAALARRLDPQTDRGVTRRPFHIPNGPHVQALFKELGELRYRLKAEKSELETKQDLMLRLDRSPDFADAICMTFRVEATHGV